MREHSFLRNPRTPNATRASAVHAAVDSGGGATELRRLQRLARGVAVLNITNIAEQASSLWNRRDAGALLSPPARRRFQKRFAGLQGGWCCASAADARRGAPRAASFHLMNTP